MGKFIGLYMHNVRQAGRALGVQEGAGYWSVSGWHDFLSPASVPLGSYELCHGSGYAFTLETMLCIS
eukprot:scaffold40583_cov15-Tisochrysis_lutea.AAC.1